MNAIEINQTYDLLALAENETNLKKTGNGWYAGSCPFCGGDDRFLIKSTKDGYRWFCRTCGDGKYHSSIDYIMRRDGLDFKSALIFFGGDTKPCALGTRAARPPQRVALLPPLAWQDTAWQEITKGLNKFERDAGRDARSYLLARGFTWQTIYNAWLGFVFAYDPKLKRQRPAILMPHYDRKLTRVTISGIKYRFIDHAQDGLRYTAKGGSIFHLYGLWGLTSKTRTLLLSEGEFNALSIKQVNRAVDVLSIGSDGFTTPQKRMLEILSPNYSVLYIWTDERENAERIRSEIKRPDAKLIKSPLVQGKKYDANQLLQDGALKEFLKGVFQVESHVARKGTY